MEDFSENEYSLDDNSFESDNEMSGDRYEQKYEATFEQEKSAEYNKNVAISCGDPIPFNIKPGTKEYVQAIANKTPLEKFKLDVDYISNILNKSNNSQTIFSIEDRNLMCLKADSVSSIGFEIKNFNPLAYILGYISTKNNYIIIDSDKERDKKIKITKMKKLIGNYEDDYSVLKNINIQASKVRSGNSFSVYPPDVIRYGRMWLRLM
jgi:hypothetical protein